MVDAPVINTVASTVISNTDSAIAIMNTTGFWVPADDAEPMRHTTELLASAG